MHIAEKYNEKRRDITLFEKFYYIGMGNKLHETLWRMHNDVTIKCECVLLLSGESVCVWGV